LFASCTHACGIRCAAKVRPCCGAGGRHASVVHGSSFRYVSGMILLFVDRNCARWSVWPGILTRACCICTAEKVLERLKLMQYPQSSAARRASHKVAPAASSFVPEERTFISAYVHLPCIFSADLRVVISSCKYVFPGSAAAPSDTVTLAELAASSAR